MSNQSNSETRSSQGEAGSLNQGAFSQWQPIETAPKDGSYFLVANHHGVYEVAKYMRRVWFKYVERSDGLFERQEFLTPCWGCRDFDLATHWMPLPPPPTEDEELNALADLRAGGPMVPVDIADL